MKSLEKYNLFSILKYLTNYRSQARDHEGPVIRKRTGPMMALHNKPKPYSKISEMTTIPRNQKGNFRSILLRVRWSRSDWYPRSHMDLGNLRAENREKKRNRSEVPQDKRNWLKNSGLLSEPSHGWAQALELAWEQSHFFANEAGRRFVPFSPRPPVWRPWRSWSSFDPWSPLL